MSRARRSDSWGFPRWGGYGGARDTVQVRLCDRVGCTDPGTCPAPKSPNSPDRWMFCQAHAAEYNQGLDYFAGLTAEEAAEREAKERQTHEGYKESAHYGWAGSGDGSRSRDELRALGLLELTPDADFDAINHSRCASCSRPARPARLRQKPPDPFEREPAAHLLPSHRERSVAL